MEEHEFACGHYTQTSAEHRQDCRVLKSLKRKIEGAIPRSVLCIDDASEWSGHWRVPLVIPAGRVLEQHFMIVRGYGARLEVEESFGDEQVLYTHYVVIRKTRHWLRAWSALEKCLASISMIGFITVAYLLFSHVQQLYSATALG